MSQRRFRLIEEIAGIASFAQGIRTHRAHVATRQITQPLTEFQQTAQGAVLAFGGQSLVVIEAFRQTHAFAQSIQGSQFLVDHPGDHHAETIRAEVDRCQDGRSPRWQLGDGLLWRFRLHANPCNGDSVAPRVDSGSRSTLLVVPSPDAMKSLDVCYIPPTPERLLEALRSRFRLEIVDDARHRATYFDTFDWRLHRDGGCLRLAPQRSGSMLNWLRQDGSSRHRLPTRIVPPFARDFPTGDFRREIEDVIAMRRLLPRVELRLAGFTVNLLDRREKTVVRLRFEEGTALVPKGSVELVVSAGPVSLAPVLRVQPIRGYDRALRRLIRCLESDLELDKAVGTELERALAAIGRRAGDYSSKVAIDLDPMMPAAAAAKTIH